MNAKGGGVGGPAVVVPWPNQTLRIEEAAAEYRLGRGLLLGLVRRGEVAHVPIGRRWLVRRGAVEEWLLAQERYGVADGEDPNPD